MQRSAIHQLPLNTHLLSLLFIASIAPLTSVSERVSQCRTPPTWAQAAPLGAGYAAQPPLPPAQPSARLPPPRPQFDAADLTLRDLLQQYAEESGIECVPKVGRTHEGLPVWAFGRVTCVVDGSHNMIRALMADGAWEAVSMEGLLQEHMRREAGGPKGTKR